MRALVWAAIAGLVAVDALYLAIVYFQGGPDPPGVLTVPFVAAYLAIMAALLGASLPAPASAKLVLRAAASAGLLVMGVVAAFSIGLLVLVIAALSVAATVNLLGTRPKILIAAGAAALLAVAVLVVGLQVTSRYIVCPATGSGGGTTGGLFGQESYQCDNGRLTTR